MLALYRQALPCLVVGPIVYLWAVDRSWVLYKGNKMVWVSERVITDPS